MSISRIVYTDDKKYSERIKEDLRALKAKEVVSRLKERFHPDESRRGSVYVVLVAGDQFSEIYSRIKSRVFYQYDHQLAGKGLRRLLQWDFSVSLKEMGYGPFFKIVAISKKDKCKHCNEKPVAVMCKNTYSYFLLCKEHERIFRLARAMELQ